MTKNTSGALRIPIQRIAPRFDVDVSAYSGLNPATYLILALCYDSLAAPSTVDSGGSPIGPTVSPAYGTMQARLAQTFASHDGGRRWTVRLREGVRSGHGSMLCADDIKWAFDKAFGLGTVGAYRWGQIAGLVDSSHVRSTGPLELEFRLRAPNPYFSSFLFAGTPMITDSATVRNHASEADPWGTAWMASGGVAGYGAYTVDDFDHNGILFRARTDNWQDAQLLREVVATPVGSRPEAIDMLKDSDPTYLIGLRPDEAVALRNEPGVWLTSSWAGHAYVGMNYARPPFDDVRVRRALSLATPYRDVVERGFLGLARPWRSPLSVYDPWYDEQHWDYSTNIAEARDLLAQAGYADGLSLSLYVPPRADLRRVGELLRAAYAAIGVEVELQDTSTIQPGWHPTFYLRAECGHNINEPVYDIAHDHVLVKPVVDDGPVAAPVDTWFGAYPGSRRYEAMYRDVLRADSAKERQLRCEDMQADIVGNAQVIWLAENLQISAGNATAPRALGDFTRRVPQALHFQNANTSYLPNS